MGRVTLTKRMTSMVLRDRDEVVTVLGPVAADVDWAMSDGDRLLVRVRTTAGPAVGFVEPAVYLGYVPAGTPEVAEVLPRG